MAITRKPKPQAEEIEAPAVDVDALINKGGSVARMQPDLQTDSPAPQAKSTVSMTLRIPANLAEQLDHHLGKSPVRVSRHLWILEAMVERLERQTQ